jgi:hypothetical protein
MLARAYETASIEASWGESGGPKVTRGGAH